MKLKKVLAAASMLILPTMVAAQLDQPLPLEPEVRYGKLDNGLTYYIRHNEEPRERVDFYIAQRVGSVQEEEDQRGLAHFLEHMCFNGTKHFDGDGVIKYCESIGVKFGAELNAYTSTDETVYNISDVPVTSGHIDSCLLIMRDWCDGLLLQPEEIEKERGVIHEEWRMRTSPAMRIYNRQLETLYPNSRYGRRMPIGLMSIVDNFEPQTLRNYYEKWYRPDLQGVIIVGDIDVDDVEKRIQKTFGDIKMPENAAKFEYYPVPDNNEPIYVIDSDKEMTHTVLNIMFKDDCLPRELKNTPFIFLTNYVNNVITLALNQRLRELSLKADCPFLSALSNYSSYSLSKNKNSFVVQIVAKKGQSKEAIALAIKEVERARRYGFVSTELFRARETIMSTIERLYENRDKQKNSFHANRLVRQFIENAAVPGIETEYQLYQMFNSQLPEEQFSEALKGYTARLDTNFVFLGMYPEDEVKPTIDEVKAIIEGSRQLELEPFVDNVKDEPLIANLPKKGSIKKTEATDFGYTQWTLSNGARVFYKKTDFSNTQVLFAANSHGGKRLIDKKLYNSAKIFNNVMAMTGLSTFTGQELLKKLAGKQVSINAQLNFYTEEISGSSTPKDLRTFFELIHLHFQEPVNDVDGYNKCIESIRTSLESKDKNPMSSFSDSIEATIFCHDKLQSALTLDELNSIKYEEIREIYRQRFQSAGDFDFYFTGNFDVDSLRLYSEVYLASLPKIKKREARSNKQELPYFSGIVTNRYKRTMEMPQAQLMQYWYGADNFSLKANITASIAGQILSKRYFKSIREDAGLAYAIAANATSRRISTDMYQLQIVCPFKPAKCDSVLLLIGQEIDNVASNGVTEDELETFRKYEQKKFTDNQRENGYWQSLITSKIQWNNDSHTNFEAIIESITSDDIKKFISKVKADGNCATIIILPEE